MTQSCGVTVYAYEVCSIRGHLNDMCDTSSRIPVWIGEELYCIAVSNFKLRQVQLKYEDKQRKRWWL